MSKAVLVMDMPRNCTRCWLVQMEIHDAEASPYCGVAEGPFGGWRTIDVKTGGRPDWCPLREMPKPKEVETEHCDTALDHYFWGFADGYNTCLDELEGKR